MQQRGSSNCAVGSLGSVFTYPPRSNGLRTSLCGRRASYLCMVGCGVRTQHRLLCEALLIAILCNSLINDLSEALWHKAACRALLLSEDDALKARVHCKAEDIHEEAGHDVAHEEVHNQRDQGGDVVVHLHQEEIADDHCGRHDEDDPNALDGTSQNSYSAKAEDVLGDDCPGLFGRGAKRCAADGNLNVGVFVEELNETLKAPQTTLHNLQY
mmetsp:Transcript_61283/g.142555  ORF Transcript_61283/g.142555 Transcript_61283/m.142555 type:complete len:213 (-) Transcript_61283:2410-3048(-)